MFGDKVLGAGFSDDTDRSFEFMLFIAGFIAAHATAEFIFKKDKTDIGTDPSIQKQVAMIKISNEFYPRAQVENINSTTAVRWEALSIHENPFEVFPYPDAAMFF